MTPELAERLSKGQLPFDGWTVQSETMDLARLRQALIKTAEFLRSSSTTAELSWLKDWFFHDQYPAWPIAFSWSEFDRMVASEENAMKFCVGDDFCTFAIFPDDFTWLFRIDVPEEQDEPGRWQGRFDLTAPLSLAEPIIDELAPLGLTVKPARDFFLPGPWTRLD